MKGLMEFRHVYLHRADMDMRRGVHSLACIIRSMKMGPIDECSLFVFTGKKKNTLKCLYWDGVSFCMWSKHLEKDRFAWPSTDSEVVFLEPSQMSWLLQGVDVWKMKRFEKNDFNHFFE